MKRYLSAHNATREQLKQAARALEKTEGVNRARVIARAGLIKVHYDGYALDEGDLSETLANAGVSAHIYETLPYDRTLPRQILSWLLTLAAIYLSFAPRWVLPLPEALSYPLPAGITQLILMLAVWGLCEDVFDAGLRFGKYAAYDAYAFSLIACLGAALYSVPALIVSAKNVSAGETRVLGLYFDSACLIPTLMTLGRFGQNRARRSTQAAFKKLGVKYTGEGFHADTEAEKKAARVSRVFMLLALILAAAALVIWLLADEGIALAVKCAVAVLVVACPAIPARAARTVLMAGAARMAVKGMPVKNARALERLALTGTALIEAEVLTDAEALAEIEGFDVSEGMTEELMLSLAASALQKNEGAFARAVVSEAKKRGIPLDPLNECESEGLFNTRALIGDTRVLVGDQGFMLKNALDPAPWDEKLDAACERGCAGMFVVTSGKICGIIALKTSLRKDALGVMDYLRQQGVHTCILAGDKSLTAQALFARANADKLIYREDEELNLRLLKADKQKLMYIYENAPRFEDDELLKIGVSGFTDAGADICVPVSRLPEALGCAKKTLSAVKTRVRVYMIYACVMMLLAGGILYKPLGFTLSPLIGAPLMLLLNLFMLRAPGFSDKAKAPKAKKPEATEDDTNEEDEINSALDGDEQDNIKTGGNEDA